MDPAIAIKLTIVASIILIVSAIGLGAPDGSVRAGLAHPGRLARAMLAMFVALPLVTLLVTWWLPVEPATRVALLALSVSPMPPILPNKEKKLGGALDYALGIQLAASVTALVAAPMLLLIAERFYGREGGSDPVGMAKTILLTIILPLAAGLTVARLAPALAAKLERPVRLTGMLLLAAGMGIVLWKAAPGIAAAATGPTLLAVLIMTVAGLGLGHWLGGPEAGNRHALAVATASRHPGVAIGIAAAADVAAKQPVVAVVLLYLLAGALFSAPYARWAKGRV